MKTDQFLYSCRELRIAGVLGLLLCAAVFALACGSTSPDGGASETSEMNASSDQEQLVLDDATMVLEADYGAILEAPELPVSGLTAVLDEYEGTEDTPDLQERIRDEWDDLDASLGTDPADVETLLSIGVQRAAYFVVKGAFDFGDIESELEDQDFQEGTYRNHRIWEHESGDRVALFPDTGIYMYGEDGVVKDVIRAIARGEGFMDDEADLRRALRAAGDGLVRLAMDCDAPGMHSPGSLSALVGRLDERCEGVAVVISGGDEGGTEAVIGYVYGSERRAESAIDDIEESIGDSDEIDVDGEIVTVRLTVSAGPSGSGMAAAALAQTPALAPTTAPAPAPTPPSAPAATPTPTATAETALQNPLGALPNLGGRIAFESSGDIYVMNADGSGVTRLTDNDADDEEPSWSPSGGSSVPAVKDIVKAAVQLATQPTAIVPTPTPTAAPAPAAPTAASQTCRADSHCHRRGGSTESTGDTPRPGRTDRVRVRTGREL